MAGEDKKRKHDSGKSGKSSKKAKYFQALQRIEPNWSGVFVTCVRGKEKYCKEQTLEVFKNYAEEMYGDELYQAEDEEEEKKDGFKDADDEIAKELASMKPNKEKDVFKAMDLDVECVFFIRVKKPVDAEKFVASICEATRAGKVPLARFAQKLTPVMKTASASMAGLKGLAPVLDRHFHNPDQKPLKFAIRPQSRLFTELTRDDMIQTVAGMVNTADTAHTVDLKNYDKMILVEGFKSTISMSVMDKYDSLHRLNLERLYEDGNKK